MSSHQPTHPHPRETEPGATWKTKRPSWAATPAPQTELVEVDGRQFWIAYPLQAPGSTLAGRVAASTGQGLTIGDALRMAAGR